MKRRAKAFTLIELLVVVAIIALLISIMLPSLQNARDRSKAAVCASSLRQLGIGLTGYVAEHHYYPGEHAHNPAYPDWIVWPPRLRPYVSDDERAFWCPVADEEFRWVRRFAARVNPKARRYGYKQGEVPLTGPWVKFCYGYNSWGVGEIWVPRIHLGLGGHVDDPSHPWTDDVREEMVKRPAEMIAIADSKADGIWDSTIDPELWQKVEWPSRRHFGGSEVLFADGHVIWESQRTLVEPTDWSRRRWNNDFLPHREWWQ